MGNYRREPIQILNNFQPSTTRLAKMSAVQALKGPYSKFDGVIDPPLASRHSFNQKEITINSRENLKLMVKPRKRQTK